MKRNIMGIGMTVTTIIATITVCSLLINNTVKAKDTSKTTVSYDNLYLSKGKVISVIEELDKVSVIDGDGEVFQFYGMEDWLVNDDCIMLMDNNGTSDIKDDIIVKTIYTNR